MALKTRPDITYNVNYCARFMSNLSRDYYKALNNIWDYLLKELSKAIYYNCKGKLLLKGYCDADWASDLVSRKSTTRYITSLCRNYTAKDTTTDTINCNLLSWNFTLQKTIALSIYEAEYYALKDVIKEI